MNCQAQLHFVCVDCGDLVIVGCVDSVFERGHAVVQMGSGVTSPNVMEMQTEMDLSNKVSADMGCCRMVVL